MVETLRITPSAEGRGEGLLLTSTSETAARPSLGDSAQQTGKASRWRKAHENVPEIGLKTECRAACFPRRQVELCKQERALIVVGGMRSE